MITFQEGLGLVASYARSRIWEQIKSNALLVLYLVFFQTMVLGIPIIDGAVIATGMALVVLGLALFMEGLVLGLMPLGEIIGLKLPEKAHLALILLFSFLLGIGATLAEPAVGVLKTAGAFVRAWEAPLLFYILNQKAAALVNVVGFGVGVAAMLGMLRFLYGWSLKPFLYVIVSLLCAVALWGHFQPNIFFLAGLAWDCGGVTTGPVTVPLVLALGIGVSRIVGGGDSLSGGFGVVTLASLLPILSIYGLGAWYLPQVPEPMGIEAFCSQANRTKVAALFENAGAMKRYILKNVPAEMRGHFESTPSPDDGPDPVETPALEPILTWAEKLRGTLKANLVTTVQAIIPLSFFLLFVLFLLRERLPQADEVFLGVGFALGGMFLFNLGIEFGLGKLGNQLGCRLPAAYRSIEVEDSKRIIQPFPLEILHRGIAADGSVREYFLMQEGRRYHPIHFDRRKFDESHSRYQFTPTLGPLFGGAGGMVGVLMVLFFAFVMGYGATLAEPALNALGATVEEISVGTFKKSMLMHAVSLGVGVGIMTGVGKIIWNLPLVPLLLPPYLFLLFLTSISSEEYVCIAWDSAGVTTGPITVPLVLAMGLGIGGQAGVVEGFGILSLASVCPIITVLLTGLYVTRLQRETLDMTGA